MFGTESMFFGSGSFKGNNPSTIAAAPIIAIDGSTDAGWGEQTRLGSLIDGNVNSVLYHNNGGGGDVRISFNRPKVIDKLGIYPRQDGNLWGRQPRYFELTATNDGGFNWTSIYSAESPYSTAAAYTWHYFPQNTKAFSLYRWNCTSTWGDGTLNFAELALVEEEETASYNLMLPWMTGGWDSALAQASSQFDQSDTYAPFRAFDGNGGTAWSSAQSVAPEWLVYELPAAKTVLEYSLYAASPNAPTAWSLQYWDGGAWVTLDSRSVNMNDGVQRYFTIANPVQAKRYRLYVSGKATAVAWINLLTFYGR